jgi:hypothetical protein
MTADEAIQGIEGKMYDPPLVGIRYQQGYPNLENPLHIVFLLIDCNIEIQMNGLLGFLENGTGEHLNATIDTLSIIGAYRVAEDLQQIYDCMSRHGVTWAKLRGDFEDSKEFEITTFSRTHGDSLRPFTEELREIAPNFDVFSHPSGEPVYDLLCSYIEPRIDRLTEIIAKIEAQQGAAGNP